MTDEGNGLPVRSDERQETRRFLVEVRGVLHVEATAGDEADRLAEAWIAAIKRGAGGDARQNLPDAVKIGYLRVFPDWETVG